MKIAIRTIINGREIDAAVKPNQTLLEWLRDDLRLRGSREGCGVGVCGSCTVLVDGLSDAGDQARELSLVVLGDHRAGRLPLRLASHGGRLRRCQGSSPNRDAHH